VPEETPQNGLSETAASGLAYFTFIPAIIFLVVAPYNASASVRFHSWQSIFLTAVAVVVWVLNMILAFIPIIGWLIMLLLSLGLLVLWILCVIKAFGGQRFKIPVIGDLAQKQAGA
jgi:uncharacterized membrane protein